MTDDILKKVVSKAYTAEKRFENVVYLIECLLLLLLLLSSLFIVRVSPFGLWIVQCVTKTLKSNRCYNWIFPQWTDCEAWNPNKVNIPRIGIFNHRRINNTWWLSKIKIIGVAREGCTNSWCHLWNEIVPVKLSIWSFLVLSAQW